MASSDQEAIETFMSITGVSEAVAVQKLEEHLGNLNEAVNAHFNEGDRSIPQEAHFGAIPNDPMDLDDPISFQSQRAHSLLPFARDLDHFSRLDRNFIRSIFNSGSNIVSRSPFVSHPREIREIPIEVKDGIGSSGQSVSTPIIEEVTETMGGQGPEIRGTVILDDDDDNRNIIPNAPITQVGPSAPSVVDIPDYSNDIEEEMIRAAIEASKQEADMSNQKYDEYIDLRDPTPRPSQSQSHIADVELARAVTLSLQTAEREKALREPGAKVEASETVAWKPTAPMDAMELPSSNGRQSDLEVGSSSIQEEDDDVEELPLVRHRRRRLSSVPVDTTEDIDEVEVTPPISPRQHDHIHGSENSASVFPSDEWGGISSAEHDEAVMLEAAMFGGIPEPSGYNFPYVPHQLLHNGLDRVGGPYPSRIVRPPSPSLTNQRLIREQQDDEYLTSLQADREKELKAKEEAESALANERRKEEELHKQLQEEQEAVRLLACKEASLPEEPTSDNENVVNILVRMPDGSRIWRRFLKSDKLQFLFDFIDVGRVVKPGSYRLVRPYPRRAFSDGESSATLNELGLTNKHEALYLELI